MSSIFRYMHHLNKPMLWELENFCDFVFADPERELSTNAHIIEIRHYKETEGLEHEFLLASVSYAQEHHMLRIERMAAQRQTFWQRIIPTSSSVLPALDTIHVSSSFEKLISGMHRGPSILVATLPIPPKTFTLRELCLILTLFPAFSPQYKLREEQCYWFCNVILATICAVRKTLSIVQGYGFARAGKFGRVSVNLSAPTRKLFVDTYTIIHIVEESSRSGTSVNVDLTPGNVNALVSMLSVPSNEAKTCAVMALTSLASHSSEYCQMVADGGSAIQMARIFYSAPVKLKTLILRALDLLDDLDSLCLRPERLSTDATDEAEDESDRDSAILHLLLLLQDPTTQEISAKCILKLANSLDMQPTIQKTLPEFARLLNSGDIDVGRCCANVLAKFADIHDLPELIQTIGDCLPRIIALLLRGSTEERIQIANLILKLIKYPDLHPEIGDTFPQILQLLGDENPQVRKHGVMILKDMVNYPDLRLATVNAFPQMHALLSDESQEVRTEVNNLFANLSRVMAFW